MDPIAFVAERKIEEAIERGLFENLPGMGRPLDIEDISHLPPELRMAYTLLKNGGYIEKLPEAGNIVSTRELLEQCPDEGQTYGKMQRLKVMLGRVRRTQGERSAKGGADDTGAERADTPYLEKLLTRV